MKALDLVANPYPVEHIEHEVFCEGALAAMRAKLVWDEGNCDNKQHIHIYRGREITVIRLDCGGCQAEFKAALDAEKGEGQ